jgi:hypothetical protein
LIVVWGNTSVETFEYVVVEKTQRAPNLVL